MFTASSPEILRGFVGMEFFQFAGEMGSARVPRAAFGVAPDAFRKMFTTGRSELQPGRSRSPHDVQHGQPRKLSRFDATEIFPHFGGNAPCADIKNRPEWPVSTRVRLPSVKESQACFSSQIA
jgi:hypothetical protein